MLPLGLLVNDAAAGAGFIAASIAICGFLGQIKPALAREEDPAVHRRDVRACHRRVSDYDTADSESIVLGKI